MYIIFIQKNILWEVIHMLPILYYIDLNQWYACTEKTVLSNQQKYFVSI